MTSTIASKSPPVCVTVITRHRHANTGSAGVLAPSYVTVFVVTGMLPLAEKIGGLFSTSSRWSYGSFHCISVLAVVLFGMFTSCATSSCPGIGLKLWNPPAYRFAGTPVRSMLVPTSAEFVAAVRPVPAPARCAASIRTH